MQPEVRRQITWVVLIAIAASLAVFASYRRHELDYLRKLIVTGRPEQRLAAVRTLIAKEKLAEALQDQPRAVQDQVIIQVARIGMPEALFQLAGAIYLLDDPEATRATQVLVRFDRLAIGPLVKALKDKDPNVRAGAPNALVAIGPPVIPSLLPLMDAWDQYVRDGVVTVFGQIGLPATPELIKIIKRTEPGPDETPQRFLWKKDTAIRSLLAMKAVALTPIIRDLLTDPNEEVRATACQMLGQIADQTVDTPIAAADAVRIIQPLLARLNTDGSWLVRRRAATALGLLASVGRQPDVVSSLIARLKDVRPEVKAAAAEALGRIGDPAAAGPLVATLIHNRFGAVREITVALQRIKAPAIAPLLPALASNEVEVRAAATEALANIGTPASVVPLAGMLKDPDVAIRRMAADALVSLADSRVLPQLVAALNDPDWRVYYAARDALANVGAPAVPILVSALGSGNPRVAHMAEQALARIGKPALPALAAALGSPNASARSWAAVACGDIGADAVPIVAAVLADVNKPPAARVAAADALGRTAAPSALEPLIKATTTAEPSVRMAALKALVRLGDEKATPTLVAALQDKAPAVRQQAMELLIGWRLGQVNQLLEEVARKGDTNAQRRAAIALAYHTSAATHELLAQIAFTAVTEVPKPTIDLTAILLPAVSDERETAEVRLYAIRALGYLGQEQALPVLAELLRPDNPFAPTAARAIAMIGKRMYETQVQEGGVIYARRRPASKAAKMLIDLMFATKDPALRLDCAVALSMMGGDPVWDLYDRLKTASDEMRSWVVAVLGAIGKPASDAGIDVRGDAAVLDQNFQPKDRLTRDWATVALALVGDAQAMDLIKHLPDEEKPDPAKIEAGRKVLEMIRAVRAKGF